MIRRLAPCLCLLACSAVAGPWQATLPSGLQVQMAQDAYRTREAYVLERRYPDGTLDVGFGQQGSTLFSLGPDNEGPTALRLDALGRPWIAGATSIGGDRMQAVVLRFTPQGLPDASYADGGRSATAPAGRSARALDLLPQADGSTLVAGVVTNAQAQEVSGWWRLDRRGQIDAGFGVGGLWADPGTGSSEVVELVPAPGSTALLLRRGEGASMLLEAWVVSEGASMPALTATLAGASSATRLLWRDGAWRWLEGTRVIEQPTPASMLPIASSGQLVVLPTPATPVPPPTAADAAASGVASSAGDSPVTALRLLALMTAAALLAALLLWLWRRRNRPPG